MNIVITRDGRPLDEIKLVTEPSAINDKVKPGENGWFEYVYRLSKDNFQEDGLYKISVSSKDATGNSPENSDFSITFFVDHTAPELVSVTGLEQPRYNESEHSVKYKVFDTIGLKSLTVQVLIDGAVVNEQHYDDFTADPNSFNGEIVLAENNSRQHVRLIAEDMAGNTTTSDAEGIELPFVMNDVTVSTNALVLWYSNKPLFWGSIGGGAAVVSGLAFFLAGRKSKKEEQAVEAK